MISLSRLFRPALALFLVLPAARLAAETLAEKTLKELLARQEQVFARAEKEAQTDELDEARFRAEVKSLTDGFDILIQKNPEFVLAYVSYADLLGRVGMVKPAVAMLFRANKLDDKLPRVKGQIAKHLAEDGKFAEALPWVLAAIDLAPREPRYHLNLGLLLAEGRDPLILSGAYTRPALDRAMLEAFRRAAELAPAELPYAYRAAEAYYDLEQPKWDEALKAWSTVEEKATPGVEKETARLHAANVLLKLGRGEHARMLLASVTDPRLQKQKQTLLDQAAPKGEK